MHKVALVLSSYYLKDWLAGHLRIIVRSPAACHGVVCGRAQRAHGDQRGLRPMRTLTEATFDLINL